jgi:UDP-N-acetylmuramate--alanine ligase
MNFGHVRHLHFVGIGGAGMCGIAELLHDEGLEVSGCDLLPSETTERLERLGIPVAIGHDAAHLERAQVVVMSSAVAADNPEVEAAHGRSLPVIRRAEMLGEISRLKWSIAIAGTHGKTTTTSLTGFALTQAGLDPTVVVGGRVHFLGAHARLGRSEYLVCEADEYDRSFLALSPVLAVLTTIEAEHLDTYGTVEAMEEAFATYAGRVPLIVQSIIGRPDDTADEHLCVPEDAVRLGADAFATCAFVRGASEAAHLRRVADFVRQAEGWEMPLILHVYPRKTAADGSRRPST